MEKPQIPVAILVRVSTAKQETARQICELRQYSDGKGYEVLEVCEETVSGSAQEDQRHRSCAARSSSVWPKPKAKGCVYPRAMVGRLKDTCHSASRYVG